MIKEIKLTGKCDEHQRIFKELEKIENEAQEEWSKNKSKESHEKLNKVQDKIKKFEEECRDWGANAQTTLKFHRT